MLSPGLISKNMWWYRAVRFFSGKPKVFLPFEEARKQVRALNLKSGDEWRALAKGQRPNGVPASPWSVYGSDYKGLPDFLGVAPARPKVRRDDGLPRPSLESRCKQNATHGVGLDRLMLLLRDEFTFFRMPRFSSTNLLFQPRDAPNPDLWAALSLRTAASVQRDGRCSFSRPRSSQECVGCFYDAMQDVFFVVLEDLDAKLGSLSLQRGGTWKHDGTHVPHPDLPNLFRSVYSSRAKRTKLEWLVTAPASSRDARCHRGLATLWSKIFEPCGVDVKFPNGGGMTHHNIELGGKRVLLRFPREPRRGRWTSPYEVMLYKQIVGHCARALHPLHVDDGVDFVMLAICRPGTSTEFLGCYLFPTKILAEQQIFAVDSSSRGRVGFTVYPPFTNPGERSSVTSRTAKEWQLPFYMDLQGQNADPGDETIASSREDRFLEILQMQATSS